MTASTAIYRVGTGYGERWESWPGSVYPYLECFDDVDTRAVQWRRAADGTIEVWV